jgi:DNA gyrase/topoisomerase IV subunit A
MNEPVNSTFAQEQVEKSEVERITEQLQTYKASVDGKLVGVVNVMIEQYLKAGLVTAQDLQAIATLSNEFNKAQIDYQTFVTTKQRRLQELQQEEMLKSTTDIQEKYRKYEQRIADEIEESRKAKKELAQVKAQLESIMNNTTDEPAKPVEKTRAFDVARALNPEPSISEQIDKMPPPAPTESWEEPEVKSIDDVTPEEWDQAVKSIKEVEVEEVKDELDLYEEQLIAEEEAELRIAEEDEKTQPNFTKPIVSGGNAPNLQQNIPTYDSEEELLEAVQAKIDAKKEEAEEEYEEITIPSEAELNAMTKADISKTAEELGFENVNTTDTKKVMIQNFVADANAFIQSLEDSGDLVSANVEGEEDDTVDRQDGGYF